MRTSCFASRIFLRGLILGLALGAGVVHAEDEASEQTPDVLATKADFVYDFDAEGRLTRSGIDGVRILREAAVERMKSAPFVYRHGLQNVVIEEAYTLKANGRRINVPPGNYQTVKVDDADNPFASQWESIVVTFPDVAVGDTLSRRYRFVTKEALPYPGTVSELITFSPFSAYEEVTVTVRVPESLKLKTESHRLEVEPPVTKKGIVTYRWRYRNPRPRVAEPERDLGIWRIGETPALYLSTFADYEAVARSYGERALPRTEVTERVRELAAGIVGAETDRREQARLLYEWVDRELSYAGECLAVGALTPRDLEVVIENRMGDCKDHAGLLQALLAAQGIPSEQVLLAEAYDLPLKTPVIQALSRVILYLPEWDLYADPTQGDMPFGYLPLDYYDRPVVHVGVADPMRTLTARNVQVPEQRIDTVLKLNADGRAEGEVTVNLRGPIAAKVRAAFMDAPAEDKARFVEALLGRQGGGQVEGELRAGDLSPEKRLSDRYEFGIRFSVERFLRTRRGAWTLEPLLSAGSTISDLAEYDDTKMDQRDHACYGVRMRETWDITLDGVQLTQLPEPMSHKTEYLDYESRITATPNRLKVDRTLTDKSPTGICSAEFSNAWTREAAVVGGNVEEQIFYVRGEAEREPSESDDSGAEE